jgi:hypothetical protein
MQVVAKFKVLRLAHAPISSSKDEREYLANDDSCCGYGH